MRLERLKASFRGCSPREVLHGWEVEGAGGWRGFFTRLFHQEERFLVVEQSVRCVVSHESRQQRLAKRES